MRRSTWFTAIAFLLAATQLRAARLEEAKIFIEFNATDRDVGVQVFLDGESWKRMKIIDPFGRKIFDVSGTSTLGSIGLSELFFEGEEPSLDELPLDEFLELFPEGFYFFEGETVEGAKLHARARFSHVIPDGPVIVSPQQGVDPDHAMIQWQPVTSPPGVEIVGYEVIVGTFDIVLPATKTSVTIPPEFLEHGKRYGFEVLAIDKSGNQTITGGSFVTQ